MSQNSIVEIAKDKMFMKNTISVADFQKLYLISTSQLSCTDYLNNSLLNAFFLVPLSMGLLYSVA